MDIGTDGKIYSITKRKRNSATELRENESYNLVFSLYL